MANKFKYNKTGTETDSLFKGNWAIDTSSANSGGGPSSITRLYNGADIPTGGYAVYGNEWVFIANNDEELIDRINDLGASVSSASEALTWIAGQPDYVVLNKSFDNIATDGLVLNLDSRHVSSFVDNKPTTNLLAAYNDGFVRSVWWTNSGSWDVNYNATNNDKPVIHGIDLSDVNLMYGRSITTGSQHFGCSSVGVVSGETYTVSVWFFQNRSGTSHPYIRTSVNNNGLGYLTYNGVRNGSWPVNQWIRISATATVQANETGIYISNYIGSQVDDQVWYCAPQVELGTEMTAFAKGVRLQNTDWYDLSGNNNPATLINGVALDSNEGLSFDGANDYAVLNTFNNKPTAQITCESLIKPMKSTLSGTIRGGAISASNSMYLGIINSIDGGATHAMHWANQTNINRQYNWNGSVPNNRWSHLVGTYDGTISRAYVNGIEIESWPQTGTIPDATYYIGTYGGTVVDGTHNFDGNIETARIYNTALTSQEIYQNYYQAPIVTDGLVLALDAGNLVSYENGAATTYNLAGTETGTLTNGVGFDNSNGGSWEFDGVDDKIVNPVSNSFNMHCLEIIFKPHKPIIRNTAPDGGAYSLLGVGTTVGNNNGINVYEWTSGMTNETVSIWSHDGFATGITADISLDFHIMSFNWNGSTYDIWLDGVKQNTIQRTPGHAQLITNVTEVIAGWNRGYNYYHKGNIAYVKAYNRSLSDNEVTQNFNAQRNRFGI